MRDTTKTRVTRAADTTQQMLAKMRAGQGAPIRLVENNVWRKAGIQQVRDWAALAVAAVPAPQHGAEYARAMLYFCESLYTESRVCEALAKAFDREGVIWRPDDQVAAAHKQVGRLRSDVTRHDPNRENIPLKTIVWAVDQDDFTGGTYERHENVELVRPDSYKPTLKVLVNGGRPRAVKREQLRYVEGEMIRPR